MKKILEGITLWKYQIFCEINFRGSRLFKTAILPFFGSESYQFGTYQPTKSAKIHKNPNSEPLNVVKWQILHI